MLLPSAFLRVLIDTYIIHTFRPYTVYIHTHIGYTRVYMQIYIVTYLCTYTHRPIHAYTKHINTHRHMHLHNKNTYKHTLSCNFAQLLCSFRFRAESCISSYALSRRNKVTWVDRLCRCTLTIKRLDRCVNLSAIRI